MKRQRLEDMAESPRCPALDSIAVDVFALDMKRKLAKNVHKKHWSEVTLEYLYSRMLEEQSELYYALKSGKAQDIIDECADVSNFALMIADSVRHA